MKPKTIDEVLFEAIEAAASYTHRVTADEADQIQAEALAQIQQLLEECAPAMPTNYFEEDVKFGWSQAIDQYKSNLRERLK